MSAARTHPRWEARSAWRSTLRAGKSTPPRGATGCSMRARSRRSGCPSGGTTPPPAPPARGRGGEAAPRGAVGGQGRATQSGVTHHAGGEEKGALDRARASLLYFPSWAGSCPPFEDDGDIAPREVPELLDIVPRNGRRGYDMRKV